MRIFGLAGWSGSGKTTLMAALIPQFVSRGFTVSTVKHAHHSFDIDQPGKDSWRHRQAGAQQVMVASAYRWALMTELRSAYESGASIRMLVATSGKSYGSVHSMLLKSGVVLRGRGGPNHRTRV